MFTLDTDHMSLVERGGVGGTRIRDRLRQIAPDDYAANIVRYEEQVRGWLSEIAGEKSTARQTILYKRLKIQRQNYSRFAILEFDERAAAEFDRLVSLKLRVGTMDMKIAAIALANGAVLLSGNRGDYEKVPGLVVEDGSLLPEADTDDRPG